MIKVSEKIKKVAEENGIDLLVIKKKQAEEILNCVQQKYIQNNKTHFWWRD